MRRLVVVCLLAGIVGLGWTGAGGAELKGKVTIAPALGLLTPVGDFNDQMDMGFTGGAQVEYYFSNLVGFGLTASGNFFPGVARPTGILPSGLRDLPDPDTTFAQFGMFASLHLRPAQRLSPYFKGGWTMNVIFESNSFEDQEGARIDTVTTHHTETDFGVFGGAGLSYDLTERTSFFTEAVVHDLFRLDETINEFTGRQYVQVWVGARFTFDWFK